MAEFDGSLGALHCSPVLSYRKLSVENFNSYLVFSLLQPHLRLTIFKLGAHLSRLCSAITKRDAQGQTDTFIRRSGGDHLIQGVNVADWPAIPKWRGRIGRVEARCSAKVAERTHVATDSGPSIITIQVQTGQQRTPHRLHADFLVRQIDTRFRQFRTMAKSITDEVLSGRHGLFFRQLHG